MVLVTGGTGFIGAYIIQELVRTGHKVRAIRRSNYQPFFISPEILNQVEWVTCDVLDVTGLDDAMNGVDAVIHSAAIVSFNASDHKKMYSTNIEGTANVVNTAIDNNIKRFVHISSVAALGRKKDGSVVNEDKKWEQSKTNTHYAISKYHAEMEVWRGIGEGLNGVVVCPTTVLGYGDWNSSSCAIFKNVYNEFPWYTTGVNGFVDVEDVARATVALLDTDISNQRFILNGDNWSFQQLFNTMADSFNKKRPTRHATKFLGGLAWRMEKIKSLFSNKKVLLTKESARVAQSKTYFDNSRILKALPGFSFTPLEQSIKLACKKYISHP
jgi:dihydroflavonol-4-reductase